MLTDTKTLILCLPAILNDRVSSFISSTNIRHINRYCSGLSNVLISSLGGSVLSTASLSVLSLSTTVIPCSRFSNPVWMYLNKGVTIIDCFLVNQLRSNHFWRYCFFNNFSGFIIWTLLLKWSEWISRSIQWMGINNTFSMISLFSSHHSLFLICMCCVWKCPNYGLTFTLCVLINRYPTGSNDVAFPTASSLVLFAELFSGRVIASADSLGEWVSETLSIWPVMSITFSRLLFESCP